MAEETKKNETANKGESGFRGVKKDDYEVLQKAAAAWTRLTGEPVKGLDAIPVLPEDPVDPEERAKKASEQLEAEAEVTKKREEAQQAERRVKMNLDEEGHPKEGKTEPLLAPMAAKQYEGAKAGATRGEPSKRTTPAPDKQMKAQVSG
jgi:hypothetical protein